jgi:uncharacterized membrane-anchored protein YitT (DUF2179 family)
MNHPIRKPIKKQIKSLVMMGLGVLFATVGLKGFLLPNGFLDGGITGISLLVNRLTGIDLSILIFGLNLPFFVLGAKQISRVFAIRTALAVLTLALMVHFFKFPQITQDKLLISIFGGFFLGSGIGLAMRGGGVIDGTEVLALNLSRRTSLTVGDVIALFNIVLFSISALVTNIETALYSILTYVAASKSVDFWISGIEEYIGVTVISKKAEEIRQAVIHELQRAVTVYKGEGGFGSTGIRENEIQILFSVVTRLEVHQLTTTIERIDPSAFVVQQPVNETRGGMIKKRPLH